MLSQNYTVLLCLMYTTGLSLNVKQNMRHVLLYSDVRILGVDFRCWSVGTEHVM
jgi:hypothetical protein